MSSLGERIRDLRDKRGMLQDELAELLGKKRSNIAGYEADRISPPIEIISKIADIFHVSVDYLLGRSEPHTYIFPQGNDGLSNEDKVIYDKYMIEIEDLMRSAGKIDEDKLKIALKFMEFTFKQDLEEEKQKQKNS
jgi:transcriptional regulator with XRE-family HTH domain